MTDSKPTIITKPKRQMTDLSAPLKRRQPPKRKNKTVRALSKIEMPLPPSVSKVVDGNIVDNTKSNVKRNATPGVKESNFLITFVPNSSVREEINPELYNKIRSEIESFARFVLDPRNISDVIKPTADNKDPKWMSKIVGIGDDKIASIEDSKTSNKRLHTHIYLPIRHRTKVQINLDNLRQIAEIMLEPLGVKGPRIDVKVERQGYTSARDYVMKGTTDDANRELIA